MESKQQRKNRPTVVVLSSANEGRPPGLRPLHDLATVHYAYHPRELKEVLGSADVLLVTDFRTDILERLWPLTNRLKWIHATSAGVDALMFPALVESGIPVTNARGIFDRSIAEYVLGMVLAFAKDLPTTLELQRRRIWRHRDTIQVSHRRVLVVGAGSIGREVGALCNSCGLRVDGVARHGRDHDPVFGRLYGIDELSVVIGEADYVVVTAPLTPDTRGLFGADKFAAMKQGSYFINVGRGPIVQTGALLYALRNGPIAGAALDVFEEEPLPSDHPLWSQDNVILSAHMAGDFAGWREALSQQFIDNFDRWRNGRELLNIVNTRKGYGMS